MYGFKVLSKMGPRELVHTSVRCREATGLFIARFYYVVIHQYNYAIVAVHSGIRTESSPLECAVIYCISSTTFISARPVPPAKHFGIAFVIVDSLLRVGLAVEYAER
jgi:hypothetical protein